ncbi:restriction endonuclease subunit S [Klebsiella grimontii]|uniref:restriction endonuclease subunit S n=1 Tax=Klebsiella grimontii TaxID=2058152 RepID=UPI0022434886|nr:restriction endonuclease subunit S [Klebsiella grimontii]
MGSKWKECELGDFIELKRGYDLPKSTRNEGSIPIISSSGFTDFHDKPMVKGPGVVTGRYGTIGEVFYSEEDFWPLNTTLYVVDFKGNDPLFVYYLLQTISYADYTDKAAVPGVNRNHLHKAKVKVPIYLDIQQKVAAQLYQLEKKVTLGKQINQTLEQMSQTLFKSWFVDFDPVIDNALDAGNPIPEALQSRAELRQKVRSGADFKPLPADIRALFPAEFEEMELGWVPRGWKEGSIPDIAFINSTSWGTKNQPDYVNYVDLSNAKDGIISSIEEIPFEDAPSRARRILKKDDLIFGLVRPANRSFAYVHVDGLTGSTGFAVVRSKNTIYKNFIYYFVTCDKNVEELARIADGGAYPAIKPDDICSLPLIIPPEEIVQRFDESTSNFRDLMNNSLVQNDHLTSLRDTLLPKLISGELSLEDLPDLVNQTEPA